MNRLKLEAIQIWKVIFTYPYTQRRLSYPVWILYTSSWFTDIRDGQLHGQMAQEQVLLIPLTARLALTTVFNDRSVSRGACLTSRITPPHNSTGQHYACLGMSWHPTQTTLHPTAYPLYPHVLSGYELTPYPNNPAPYRVPTVPTLYPHVTRPARTRRIPLYPWVYPSRVYKGSQYPVWWILRVQLIGT